MSMEMNYKVYVHINKVNGKRYYGITKNKPKTRWQNGKGYKYNEYFTNAINKYGWNEGFEHIILFEGLTEEEAKLLEQFYIALYGTTNPDNGYNMTLGGEGGLGYKHTEETIEKLKEINKGKGAKTVKIVELNKEFDSVRECAEYLGCDRRKVSDILNGRRKSYKGYHIIYTNKEIKNISKKNKKKNKKKNNRVKKPIYIIELDMTFGTIKECAKYLKCGENTVSNVLKGRIKTYKGYHIIYDKDKNNKELIEEVMKSYNDKAVYVIELDMIFGNNRECAEYLDCNISSISSVLRGKNKRVKGYHIIWAKDKDNKEVIDKAMEYCSGQEKSVYVIELDKEFKSMQECDRYLGCSEGTVSTVLNSENRRAKGYHIIYAKDKDNKELIEKVMKNNGQEKSVYIIELDKEFKSINDCADFLGCRQGSISNALRNKRTFKGYHIIYAKDRDKLAS